MVRNINPLVPRKKKWREARGFSNIELKEAKISVFEARILGIPVDTRRRTSYQENIEYLKNYIKEARDTGIRYSKPRNLGKGQPRRAYRGLTAAGKKMRNLSHKK
jgi:large subunit ribosomal protein L13e